MTRCRILGVNTTHTRGLDAEDQSVRLRAALAVGTDAEPEMMEALVHRCAVEPDFYVRDMLTWALCRLPADLTVPRLRAELASEQTQARSQALHTLSKIGDPQAWPDAKALLHDEDDEVARASWRAAVALVPQGSESELAQELVRELGRGDRPVLLSASRALASLGDWALPVLDAAEASTNPRVRAHAVATRQLVNDPESSFAMSIELAKRVDAEGPNGG